MTRAPLLLLLLGGCSLFAGGDAQPRTPGWETAEGTPGAGKGSAAPACITPPDEAGAITRASAEGTSRVHYCIGDTSQCYALDLNTGKLDRLANLPRPRGATDGARLETRNPELTVCTGESCKTLTQKVLPSAAQLHAATDAAGTTLVVLLGDAAAGQGYAEIWDVAKAKKTSTFRYARGDFKCGDVAMLGNSIYVTASQCTSPAARGALYSLKGAKIANVGNKDFGVFGNAHVLVEADRWAFLEENANRIAIQDVAKGKVEKTIDVSALFGDKRDAMGNPGESALLRLGEGKLAVIAGSPANGSVAVVDLATSEVKVTHAPLCR